MPPSPSPNFWRARAVFVTGSSGFLGAWVVHELKARGFSIVHVVPATQQNPATPTEPQDWMLHPPSENVATSHWPKIPNFVYAGAGTLPAPALPSIQNNLIPWPLSNW